MLQNSTLPQVQEMIAEPNPEVVLRKQSGKSNKQLKKAPA